MFYRTALPATTQLYLRRPGAPLMGVQTSGHRHIPHLLCPRGPVLSPVPSGIRGPQTLSLPAQEEKPQQQKRKPSPGRAFPPCSSPARPQGPRDQGRAGLRPRASHPAQICQPGSKLGTGVSFPKRSRPNNKVSSYRQASPAAPTEMNVFQSRRCREEGVPSAGTHPQAWCPPAFQNPFAHE